MSGLRVCARPRGGEARGSVRGRPAPASVVARVYSSGGERGGADALVTLDRKAGRVGAVQQPEVVVGREGRAEHRVELGLRTRQGTIVG